MDLEQAADLARDLMDEYDLGSWSFAFDNAKRRCGNCNFKTWTITLSRYYVAANSKAEVKDTILHEVAHAIAGFHAGHGLQWQKVAAHIGAKPQRCADAEVSRTMPKAPWKLVCASGHDFGPRHRRHAKLTTFHVCGTCRTRLQYVPNT